MEIGMLVKWGVRARLETSAEFHRWRINKFRGEQSRRREITVDVILFVIRGKRDVPFPRFSASLGECVSDLAAGK